MFDKWMLYLADRGEDRLDWEFANLRWTVWEVFRMGGKATSPKQHLLGADEAVSPEVAEANRQRIREAEMKAFHEEQQIKTFRQEWAQKNNG